MKSQSLKRLQLSTCLCLLQRAAGWVAPQTCECFTFLDGKLYWVRFATWGSFFFSHQSGALISFLLRLLLHAKYNLCTKEWNAAENCQFSPHLLLPSYFNDNTSCFFVLTPSYCWLHQKLWHDEWTFFPPTFLLHLETLHVIFCSPCHRGLLCWPSGWQEGQRNRVDPWLAHGLVTTGHLLSLRPIKVRVCDCATKTATFFPAA